MPLAPGTAGPGRPDPGVGRPARSCRHLRRVAGDRDRTQAGLKPVDQLSRALEAILFSSNRALKVRELQQATEADRETVEGALEELGQALGERGLMLQRHKDEVQLVTRPEVAAYVRRALRPDVTGRLSAAAYETLAIVAYQQPVTRSRIEEIRGVSCESVLGNLELRDLVTEVGRGPGPGQPKLYGTTMRFLQVLGLSSVKDLPPPRGAIPA
ncbi:MAG: SMC-Scp complex subunit ScpB [Chloroflexi bacterium]|nr:MAG: SMC-Scp complex subunit ScpB [Chloroflexota bacterium]